MPTTRNRRTRAASADVVHAESSGRNRKRTKTAAVEAKEEIDEETVPEEVYPFEGVDYATYQEMVDAKRKRNQQKLLDLGFSETSSLKLSSLKKAKSTASQRGIQRKKEKKAEPAIRRRSRRVSGESTSLVALDYNVANWNKDNSTIVKIAEGDGDLEEEKEDTPSFFKGRVNDGDDLTLQEAIELNEPKWVTDESLELAQSFQKEIVALETTPSNTRAAGVSVKSIEKRINNLSIENEEWVAKVTPDRIYSVACHPSETKMIAGAGDKRGYVGLWDVDSSSENTNGVHLFRPHSRPVCCMDWVSKDSMVSASYDGTVRLLNVETGTFQQIFATYNDDSTYLEELGYDMDEGYNYWTQYVAVDKRYQGSSPSLFMSTSAGTAMHIDLRASDKQKITFNEDLSEKKINSLSLHPDGNVLASGGLDNTVNLWDIRKFGSKSKKAVQPVASRFVGRSVNSAFFSPDGNSLLLTTMMDKLEIFHNAHLRSKTVKPTKSISHNNQTGRWLTTFMAQWHPSLDIFVCGSMSKPRCIEAFYSNGNRLRKVTGEALGSVMSRCCYHPSTEKLAIVGGNSSGRVVVIR